MYRISAPGQWASICQSPSAMRLAEKITRGDLLIPPICAPDCPFSSPGKPEGSHLESCSGGDQFFDLVEIQRCASSSVAKSPTRDSGPYPAVTTTVHRPFLIILE